MWCPKQHWAAPDLHLRTCHQLCAIINQCSYSWGKLPRMAKKSQGLAKLKETSQSGFPCTCFCSPRSFNCSLAVAESGLNLSVATAFILSIVHLFSGWFISCWAPVQVMGAQIPVLKSIPCCTAEILFLLPPWGWTSVHQKLNSNVHIILHTAAL